MTTKGEWKVYTDSEEQIAEIEKAENGYVIRFDDGQERRMKEYGFKYARPNLITHYWLIPADPLRDMKIRQATTGQPVWVKEGIDCIRPFIYETEKPDWNIPNAEYSFTPFED